MATTETDRLRKITASTQDKQINGQAIAMIHRERLIDRLKATSCGRRPSLVSFCNTDDLPSTRYTKIKQDTAHACGIDFFMVAYDQTTPLNELRERVIDYNEDPFIDGVMVQLTGSNNLAYFQKDLLGLINPYKDVDGLTAPGRENFPPATVKGVMSILDESERIKQPWTNNAVVVIGSTGIVGKPLVTALQTRLQRSVIQVAKDLGSLEDIKNNRIVISATGEKHLIEAKYIQEDAILIDIGLGDMHPEAYLKCSAYTPRTGGVGPMTVISLLENVVDAWEKGRVYEDFRY